MIPKSLTIKGMYSYKEKAIIDFQELLDGGLFGIFGPVGSGKSAILEAITFALYNRSDRLGSSKNYNIMNLSSHELWIDLIFSSSGREYRFTVKGKRNRNKFEEVRMDRDAYKKENGEWKPINDDAASVLGLSYKNFRRTIIIPQGKFQEFLELKDKERTDMIKELFGLEAYELYYPTQELLTEVEKERTEYESYLKAFGEEVSRERVEERKKELKTLESSIEQLERKRKGLQGQVESLRKTRELAKEWEDKKERSRKLEEKEPEVQAKKEKAKEKEKVERGFRGSLEKMDELQRRSKEVKEGLAKVREQLQKEEKELEGVEKEFLRIEKERAQRESLLKKGRDLEKAVSIKDLQKEREKKKGGLDQKRTELDKATKEHKALETEWTELEKEYSARAREVLSEEGLAKAKEWVRQAKEYSQTIEEEKKRVKDLETHLSEQRKQAGKELKEVESLLNVPIPAEPDIDEWISACDKRSKALEGEEKELRSKEEKVAVNKELTRMREMLKKGEPCPLCGSKDHPDVLDPEHIQKDLEALNERRNELDRSRNAIQKVLMNLRSIKGIVGEAKGNLSKAVRKKEKVERSFQEHVKAPPSERISGNDLETIEKTLEKEGEKRKEFLEIEKEFRNKQAALEKKKETYLGIKEGLQNLEKEADEKDHKLNTLKDTFEELVPDQWVAMDREKLVMEKQNVKNKAEKVEQEYKEVDERRRERKEEVEKLRERRKYLEEEQKRLDEESGVVDKGLKEKMAQYGYREIREIRELLDQDLDPESTMEEVREFEREKYNLQQRMKELSEVEGVEAFREDALLEKEKAMDDLEVKVQNKRDERARKSTEIERQEKDLLKKKEYEERLEKIRAREEDLQVLRKMFKGSGFVNYVSRVYLQELVNSANHRFHKLSGQQLLLELGENNEIRVRDLLNNGQSRSIQTLSGGQTFQASLCLALALAESVREHSKDSGRFFFLDEGFGTLDKEALATVMESLHALRKEGRTVGVISHVEDMQESIDVHLKVRNDPEKGSQVIHPGMMG